MNKLATLSLAQPTSQKGMVKWFDSTRGFGFVVIDGVETDFLLHQNVLHGFGRTSIAEGSGVEFAYQSTDNGYKITELFSITPPQIDVSRAPEVEPDIVFEERVPARVKWFDPAKGYGFVNQFGSAEDIFVGIAILRKSMLGELQSGDALCIQIAETDGRKSVFSVHDWC
ncbi:CspA family cold shock protein [Yoonia maricola]|uniref:CspA family cold shock protein n=1 Tax=Yoonia maricola TaxID=420999 RepID=A0A2M8W0H0_9RHOB|nr:cold shock domain-containing protein [Yoonia maricola]PJI84417.1 CspA family cold shock protein [Yoonia maricola]